MTSKDKRVRLAQLERDVLRLREDLGEQAEGAAEQPPSRRETLLLDAERVAHFGSWTWNLHADEIAWSDELFRILGLEPGSVQPSSPAFLAAVHPEDRERVQTASRRCLDGGETVPIDFRVVRPSGEERQVHMEAAFVEGEQGPRMHLVGTVLDETDKKRTAALLAQIVADLNEAQRIACIGSWRWHLPERRVEWSEGMYRLLGVDSSETPSEELFYRHVHPDDLELTRNAAERALSTQTAVQFELRMLRADRSVREMVMRSHAVFDEHAKLTGFQGIIQDGTDTKALEEAARHVQKMEAIGTLAGGVAHDFNNYLMVLGGHVELLSASLPAGHPGQRSLAAIQFAYERCVSLTEQLLTLSRKRSTVPCSFDLAERVEAIAPMLRSAVGSNIGLTLDLERGAPLVHADPSQVEHALMNLAVNARDGMPDGGTLTLRLETVWIEPRPAAGLAAGCYVRLSLADTGCGIPNELLSRIFEPFFTTKAVGQGTGLGLAVVYGIVRDAGGGIEVESRVGEGTTFHLFFHPAQGVDVAWQKPRTAEGAAGHGERVLLVEDVELVRELLRNQLTQAGYEVIVASDGVTALSLLTSRRVDAVLSDVVMPNMGGIELVRSVQEHHPGLPCLLMSGYSELSLPDARHRLSVPLLRKPFTSRELRSALSELLQNSAARKSE